MRRRRFRWQLKRKWPLVLLTFLLLSGGAAGAYYLAGGRLPASLPVTPSSTTGRINVLLLGTDARIGDPSGRTDTMILASIDPSTKQVALLSIPRDTRVDLPGHAGDKINDADVYGGPQEAMSETGNLLGIDINYYVLTNFNGFKDIVDTLGGLTIDVKSDMYHYDPMDGGIYTINLKKGVQHLNGTQALEYVRFRDDPTGDIARTERQQAFLAALLKQMMQPSSLPKLPELAREVWGNVQTNLPLTTVLSLVRLAAGMDKLQVVHQTLPGYFATVDGISYWVVDPDQARTTAAQLLNGQTTSQVILDTPAGVSQSTYAPPRPAGVTANVGGQAAQTGVSSSTYGGIVSPGPQDQGGASPAKGAGSAPKGRGGAVVQFRRIPGKTTTGSNAAGG